MELSKSQDIAALSAPRALWLRANGDVTLHDLPGADDSSASRNFVLVADAPGAGRLHF
jgi:hypothetical protein